MRPISKASEMLKEFGNELVRGLKPRSHCGVAVWLVIVEG